MDTTVDINVGVSAEMRITMDVLNDIGACAPARREFISVFGQDGSPTAKDVFIALANANRSDWLFWIGFNLKGFIEAVGNVTLGEFACVISGEHQIKAGFMLASGSASVEASGSASVEASGSASVEASGSASVLASGSASVEAYGSASVEASGSASVRASGSASVEAYDSASVRASGSASVEAYDSASVRASGSATILLSKFSIGVRFVLKAIGACVVDRRSGDKPNLITMEATDEPTA